MTDITGYRKLSRTDWGTHDLLNVSLEQVNTGALQRIADATEKMAQNYDTLIRERDSFKRYYENECASNARRTRQLIALRGVITKLRKKALGAS